jgi:hypothetical protein
MNFGLIYRYILPFFGQSFSHINVVHLHWVYFSCAVRYQMKYIALLGYDFTFEEDTFRKLLSPVAEWIFHQFE